MTDRIQLLSADVRKSTGWVLHVGCADPNTSMNDPEWLHAHLVCAGGDRIMGMDPNETRIREMQKAGYRVTTDCDGLSMKFSLIIAGEVMEHVQDQSIFLKRMREMLTIDGVLILTTPNPFAFTHAAWFWLSGGREHHGKDHVLWHSPDTLRTVCTKAGLSIRAIRYASYGRRRRPWWTILLGLAEIIPTMRQTIVYEIEKGKQMCIP